MNRRQSPKKSAQPWLVGALVLLAIAGIAWAIAFQFFFGTPTGGGEKIIVEIPPGSGLASIAGRLEKAGVIKNAKGFAMLAKSKGQAGKLKAGEYEFTAGMPLKDVLKKLVRGEVLLRRVTIPEGYTIYQIAKTLADAGVGEQAGNLALMTDPQFIASRKISAKSLEGYLFPETYSYVKGTAAKTLLSRMVQQGNKIYDKEAAGKKTPLGLDRHQVLTLASICEKEARVSAELPKIAGVYLNRLKKPMLLQADPTVAYGLKIFDHPITRADWKRKSPYNTYIHMGLPPGPIGAPGRAAIGAVFSPAETNALYFVAKDDGSHHFSATYEEHLAAIRKYRR